jgi:hypothetical protein
MEQSCLARLGINKEESMHSRYIALALLIFPR